MLKIIKLKAETLTPIYIGTNEEIDPFDYVIDENKKLNLLNINIFTDLISNENKTQIKNAVNNKSIDKIRCLIRKSFLDLSEENKNKCTIRKIDVSDEFFKKYKEELEKSKVNNVLVIKTFVNSLDKPILPGSSLKGAIRTGLLHSKAISEKYKQLDLIENINKSNKKDIKKYLDQEPFKSFKIRDTILNLKDNPTIIDIVERKNKNGSSIPIYMELLKEDIKFEIEIEFGNYFDFVLFHNLEEFKLQLKEWTLKIKEKIEKEKINLKKFKNVIIEKIEAIYNNIKNQSDGYLLRVGFGSGFDFITCERYRDKDNKIWGASKNLISGFKPLGFLKIKDISEINLEIN